MQIVKQFLPVTHGQITEVMELKVGAKNFAPEFLDDLFEAFAVSAGKEKVASVMVDICVRREVVVGDNKEATDE